MWIFGGDFVPRSHCGLQWTPNLVLINQVANFLIFLSYSTIPLSLLYFWVRLRRSQIFIGLTITSRLILLNFVCFIMFCGLTHLCDVIAFDWAPYRFFTLVDVLTALASVPTAIILPGVLRVFLNVLRGTEQNE